MKTATIRKANSSMGFFNVFQIVQLVPNCEKHHMYNSDNSLHKPGLQLVPTAYQVLEAATEGVLYKKNVLNDFAKFTGKPVP